MKFKIMITTIFVLATVILMIMPVIATTDSLERTKEREAAASAATSVVAVAGEKTSATILGAAAITGNVVGNILVLADVNDRGDGFNGGDLSVPPNK